jgi:transposase
MRVMGDIPAFRRPSMIDPFERLIDEWYRQYPRLKAIQVLERLRSYGFAGGYTMVKLYTKRFRKKRGKQAYHELVRLPGEETQIDWMERKMPFGTAYGFVFILSYSRYLYGAFYPKHTSEFFLDGHIAAMKEVRGVTKTHTYDNLKSVVLKRKPETVMNPQFLDFSRHFGFAIHLCTPGRANEKGRVEKVIQSIDSFLQADTFATMDELNRKFTAWRHERNRRIHRTTGKVPADLLAEERLNALPAIDYRPVRFITVPVSSTGFVTLDTNRYSVPSSKSGMVATLAISPVTIEVVVDGKKVAHHRRSFEKNRTIEHPSHRERLLSMTPHYKHERIYQLMKRMAREMEIFLSRADGEGEDCYASAHTLFRLLRGISKETLISAVREANSLGICRTSYIEGLLTPGYVDQPVRPQKKELLEITCEGRNLADYDELV